MEDFDFDDEQATTPPPLDPNIRKQLREAEKARKELEAARAELEAQRREVMYAKAGIPETGVGALFRKADEGDMTVEAIRKRAEEYGIVQPDLPVANASATNAELDALRRTQGATVGSSGARPDQGQEFMAQLREASSPEEVMRIIQGDAGQGLGLWSSKGTY